MPLYEFQCEKCGHVFDVMQKMSDPNPACPYVEDPSHHDYERLGEPVACGGETKKLISRGSFQLKGGGWYKDGYS